MPVKLVEQSFNQHKQSIKSAKQLYQASTDQTIDQPTHFSSKIQKCARHNEQRLAVLATAGISTSAVIIPFVGLLAIHRAKRFANSKKTKSPCSLVARVRTGGSKSEQRSDRRRGVGCGGRTLMSFSAMKMIVIGRGVERLHVGNHLDSRGVNPRAHYWCCIVALSSD